MNAFIRDLHASSPLKGIKLLVSLGDPFLTRDAGIGGKLGKSCDVGANLESIHAYQTGNLDTSFPHLYFMSIIYTYASRSPIVHPQRP